ncbi:MAG: hypothetical protein WCL16_10420 [bacterium]
MTNEERLDKLEHELKETTTGLSAAKRRIRWLLGGGAVLILVGLSGLFTMLNGTIRVNTIRVKTLQVTDDNRHPRVLMTVDQDGPVLLMRDANGQPRTWINVDKDGPGLHVADTKGKIIWFAP